MATMIYFKMQKEEKEHLVQQHLETTLKLHNL